MPQTYGFLKARLASDPRLQPSRKGQETQYHIRATLTATAADGSTAQWDSATNVGTNNSSDLLHYKLVFDYAPSLLATLSQAPEGFQDLTGTHALPALDFLRSNVLANTGMWRPTDPQDGSTQVEPVASLLRLLINARSANAPVYLFGHRYADGSLGMHDIHMNQGSGGQFRNTGHNTGDHNEIWQDGAMLVDLGQPQWAAFFTAFNQQLVPTDIQGNSLPNAHSFTSADEGSLPKTPPRSRS